jgi:hypothetical protein
MAISQAKQPIDELRLLDDIRFANAYEPKGRVKQHLSFPNHVICFDAANRTPSGGMRPVPHNLTEQKLLTTAP